MIYVDVGSGEHGCGIAGENLVRALSALAPVQRVSRGDSIDEPLPGPLLERLRRTFRPTFTSTRPIAYVVFEDDLRMRRIAGELRGRYYMLAPACRWCEDILRHAGLTAVTTIHQGIDPARFNPTRAERHRSDDRFTIFSGGKLEFRKGQDLVLEAFRIFAERHADAHLIASWHNPWRKYVATMAMSPRAPVTLGPNESLDALLRRWVVERGVDPARVTILPRTPNASMAEIYGQTDVGLFPNRCEGSTNLVMMEYMACGRVPIATNFSGHRDILTSTNSLLLRTWKPLRIVDDDGPMACWCEPDLEEIVETLELAYRSRDRLESLGSRAAVDLTTWTWERTARRFLDLLESEAIEPHVGSATGSM